MGAPITIRCTDISNFPVNSSFTFTFTAITPRNSSWNLLFRATKLNCSQFCSYVCQWLALQQVNSNSLIFR
jgi:putative flippase GtrA